MAHGDGHKAPACGARWGGLTRTIALVVMSTALLALTMTIRDTAQLPTLATGASRPKCEVERVKPNASEVWPVWQRCWATGRWRRLDKDELVARDKSYSDVANMRNRNPALVDNYTWTVDSSPPGTGCAMHPYLSFDRGCFCDMLAGRTIFGMHDSLGNQMADALARLASAPFNILPMDKVGFRFPYRGPIVDGLTICEDRKPARVVGLHNFADGHVKLSDALPSRNVSSMCFKPHARNVSSCKHVDIVPGSERDRIWGLDEFLGEWATAHGLTPDIVILNAGAHFQPDDVLIPQVRRALAYVTTTYPATTVIWRNTAPGHVNCSSYRQPLSAPQPPLGLPYNWSSFPRQNAAIAELIKTEFRTVYYMDVATSTTLRADLHASAGRTPPTNDDCLHYIYYTSNPIENWVRLLYNVLVRAPMLQASSTGSVIRVRARPPASCAAAPPVLA